MTPSSPDSAYASRPLETDTAQWTTPAPSEYQTPSTGASASTLAPGPTTERAEKPEQSPELPRKGRRASPSPKERHRGQTRQETAHDDYGYGKEAAAPRRKAQSMLSTRNSQGSSRSKSSKSKRVRERLQWHDLDDSNTEENGSSAVNDEHKVTLSRRSSRRSRSNRRPQLSLRADSSSSSLSESSIQSTRRERSTPEIAEPEKKDELTDVLKKQVVELQKQLAELKKDQSATLTKRVAELEAHLTEAKSPAATAHAPNTALPRATTGATGPRPTEFIPPRDGTCWGCGDPRHRHWACPKLSNAEKCRLYCRSICRIDERSRPNADGLSKSARSLEVRPIGAVQSARQNINNEQLNAACNTDTEREVMNSEQSELEEQIPSARPVHALDKEPAETEVRPSVRESLAACQRFDSELGKLVRMRLQSAEQPALALLSTRSGSAKKLNITKESSDVQDRYSPLKLAFLTSGGIMTTGPHQRSERKY